MAYTNIRYGILLSSEQLDFLRDDRQGFHRTEALATFVRMAAMEAAHYEKKNFKAELDAGQFAVSTVELSGLWGCDRKTTAKVIRLFNEMGILTSEANNRTTVHTIHCLAFRLGKDGDEEKTIKNPHYTRCPFIKSVCKTETTEQPAVDGGGMKANNKAARIIDNAIAKNESDTGVQPVHSVAIDSGVQRDDRSTDSQTLHTSGAALGEEDTIISGFPTSDHVTDAIGAMKHGQLDANPSSPISSDAGVGCHVTGDINPTLGNDHTPSNTPSHYPESPTDGLQVTDGKSLTPIKQGI